MNRTRIISFVAATAIAATLTVAPPASAVAANVALGKPATASSVQNSAQGAAKAVDGDGTTRWGSNFADNQWLTVDLGGPHLVEQIVLRWEAAYAKSYQIRVSYDAINWTTVYWKTDGKGGTEKLVIGVGTGRYVQMYGITRATAYGFSLWDFAVYGYAPNTLCQGGTGLGATATASSTRSATMTPAKAIDDDRSTRWTSNWTDNEWLRVDLLELNMICRITLVWEGAYGKAYTISVSDDAQTWTTVFSKTNGTGGTELINVQPESGWIQARYIKLVGTQRGTPWGYSLWEFKVNG